MFFVGKQSMYKEIHHNNANSKLELKPHNSHIQGWTNIYALPVKIVPNSIVYYENIDFAVLVDRQTETWESAQLGHNFLCNHKRKAKYYCNKAKLFQQATW